MTSRDPLVPLLSAMRAATRWLTATRTKGAIVGGVAASLHGRPRVTRDVDLVVLVPDDRWEGFVAAAARQRIKPREPDVIEFARTTRVLLMRHTPTGIDLDVSLGALPFERQVVTRARKVRVGREQFPIASPEDIVIMKALALRPRDIADIEGILDVAPRLDLARIRKTVREFGAALEIDDLESELERLLRHRRRKR